ncbi:phospholipid phosphatase 1-like [Ylistrum balloti]|uniref:phospholipid phosphatase 1-like n=1 Tax=Ylistrum balloti TaxID=509963 RepID=UPI002905AE89|nr:phospholipid phosphatase 1-like [Ylistrum balloti]
MRGKREHSPRRGDSVCHRSCSLSTRKAIIRLIVDTILWIIVGLPILLLYKTGTPYHAGFFCDDQSLRYPYKKDTIPDPLLLGLGFFIPFFMMLMTEVIRCLSSRERSLANRDLLIFFKGVCVFVFGFTVVEVFIQGFKFSIGRPRPHFFDVCRPNFSSINCSEGYITNYECTGTVYSAKIMRESRFSFLSGHAAFSMYGAIFTSLYLEKRVRLTYSLVLKPVLQLSLVVLSLACSLTRYYDYKHHVSDIIAGLLLGVCTAVFIYKALGEKALQDSNCKQVTLNLPRFEKPNMSGEARTPTPLLLRQDSSFTSADSRDYLCNNGHIRRTDIV